MAVAERTVRVENRLGIHARPAAEIVKVAARFSCMIQLAKDAQWVNGKSIMGVMTLAAEQGSELTIRAEGDDAQAAVDALAECAGKKWEEW
ncbi:MAG TPA: HPr family phosphocarrier protein [Gemmatimonadales bacterium]